MRQICLGVCTLLMLIGLIAPIQQTRRTIEPTVSRAIGAIQPRISPDGTIIVTSYQGSLWTIPRMGGVMTRLTRDAGFDIEPVWSPDGQHIAYVNSPRFGAGELQIISKTGQRVELSKRIEVLGGAHYFKLEWIGGNRLLGMLRVNGQTQGLGWVNWKTGEVKSLAKPRSCRYGVSAEGRHLIFTTTLDQPGQQAGNDGVSTDLWRLSVDGGEPEKLFRFPSRIYDLSWSADGNALYVVTDYGGGEAHYNLWIVPFREPLLRMRRLTFGQADEDRPSVSSDGHWLAYTDNQRGPTAIVVRNLEDDSDDMLAVEKLEFGTSTGQLKLNVLEQPTNQPATARVSVTQIEGKLSAPPGTLYRVLDDLGHFYCQQSAEWTVPTGRYRIRAFRGLEYRPFDREIEISANQTTEVKVDLERWAELPTRGWYSGENHIHANYGYGQWYSSPQTMLEQCAGEGIGVCNFVVANSDTDGIFDREYFTGRQDSRSTGQTILYWNQEFRSTIWGHMTLVNLKQVVEPIMTGFKETTNPWDIPTNADIADRTHMQGGHVNYTHVAQNPEDPYENAYTGKGIPVDAALGKVDTLDLNMSYAGTTVLWHRLLNCGFRLPVSAGTDCFLNRIVSRHPGADRVYVKLDGPLNYDRWIEGLRAGRSFVTNGPMLELSIDKYQLGDTIKLDRPRPVTITATAESFFPMTKVEVIYNGKSAVTVPLSENQCRASIELPVLLDRTGWLALRASGPGHPDHAAGTLDAHTSPIYVEVAGNSIECRDEAEFFLKWIDRLSLALRVRDRTPNSEMKRHLESQLEAARTVYSKLAESGR